VINFNIILYTCLLHFFLDKVCLEGQIQIFSLSEPLDRRGLPSKTKLTCPVRPTRQTQVLIFYNSLKFTRALVKLKF